MANEVLQELWRLHFVGRWQQSIFSIPWQQPTLKQIAQQFNEEEWVPVGAGMEVCRQVGAGRTVAQFDQMGSVCDAEVVESQRRNRPVPMKAVQDVKQCVGSVESLRSVSGEQQDGGSR
jgi:hypothetical protein